MANLIINEESISEDFFDNALLIGIVSSLSSYNICWLINRHLEIDFAREPDNDIVLKKKGEIIYLPFYLYNLPNRAGKYIFYQLKFGKETLLPEIKDFDFLWIVQTLSGTTEVQEIMQQLKFLPEIQLARLVPIKQIVNRMNLLV